MSSFRIPISFVFGACFGLFLSQLPSIFQLHGASGTSMQVVSPSTVDKGQRLDDLPLAHESSDAVALAGAHASDVGCSADEIRMGKFEDLADTGAIADGSYTEWVQNALDMRSTQALEMPSPCRQRRLSHSLSKDATLAWAYYKKELLGNMSKHFHPIWIKYMKELFDHERQDSAKFNEYTALGWKPAFWGWADSGTQADFKVAGLENDTQWEKYTDMMKWTPYGSAKKAEVKVKTGEMTVSGKNVQAAWYIMTMQAITGLSLDKMDTILEFGGGTSMQGQLSYRFGFKGRYIVYDLIPVGLLQRYFLRMAGFPTFRFSQDGEDGEGGTLTSQRVAAAINSHGKNWAGVLLVSNIPSLGQIMPQQGVRVFFATYSLSESPVKLREEIEPVSIGLDVFYIWFADTPGLKWEKSSADKSTRWGTNLRYFQGLLERLGEVSFCIWHGGPGTSPGSYGFVAMRRHLGSVKCLALAECSEKTVLKCA